MGNVKILLDFGRRVQYSVFEAHLECSSLENLKERLQKVISQAEDSVGIYRICGECKKVHCHPGTGNGYTRARCLCDLKME